MFVLRYRRQPARGADGSILHMLIDDRATYIIQICVMCIEDEKEADVRYFLHTACIGAHLSVHRA